MNFSKNVFAVVVSSLMFVGCGDNATLSGGSDADGIDDAEALSLRSEEMNAVLAASAQEHSTAEIARLALHRSKNAAVLAYATASRAAHEAAYRELRDSAEALHMRVSRTMSLAGQQHYAALFVHGSATFDAAYKDALETMQSAGIDHAQTLYHATSQKALRSWATHSVGLYSNEQEARASLP